MRKIFLIDTENIGRRFLPGLENTTNEDKIVIFNYVKNTIPTDIMLELSKANANVEVKQMENHHKNAMDFQIVTYLSLLVAQYQDKAEYYIVSKDHGYASAIELIKNTTGIEVKEVINLDCLKEGASTRLSIDELLEQFSKKVRREAAAGLRKTTNICDYHNYLQKALPVDGKIVYQIIKPQNQALRTYC